MALSSQLLWHKKWGSKALGLNHLFLKIDYVFSASLLGCSIGKLGCVSRRFFFDGASVNWALVAAQRNVINPNAWVG